MARRRWLSLLMRGVPLATLAWLAPWARAALPGWARDWDGAAFSAKGEAAVLAALGWPGPLHEDVRLELEVPEINESGAVVPVRVRSRLPGTRSIALLALDNPNTLAACFEFGPGLVPAVATRIKLAGTTTVLALARTDAGVHAARRLAKVTQGGCGG
ncbi:MAG: thiosulfate oxidation carrier protein SoxY [Pseudomonadota bacterium]|nr:thiosulfate oxidation carrier protein SoxY [Pseudomonadota bacterium]